MRDQDAGLRKEPYIFLFKLQKKSVWGGAIRPCKSRVASRPSRKIILWFSSLTVKVYFRDGYVLLL